MVNATQQSGNAENKKMIAGLRDILRRKKRTVQYIEQALSQRNLRPLKGVARQ